MRVVVSINHWQIAVGFGTEVHCLARISSAFHAQSKKNTFCLNFQVSFWVCVNLQSDILVAT